MRIDTKRFRFMCTCLSLLVLVVTSSGLAQIQSQLTGSVRDSSAAVIPGASITARNVATGVTYTAITNESGIYTIPYVPPGQYSVSCELPGFKKYIIFYRPTPKGIPDAGMAARDDTAWSKASRIDFA